MAKRASPRLVKTHRNYTCHDAAKLLGVNKRTVGEWIKSGDLPALTDQRPFLILGANLKAFLEKRRAPKAKCLPHQCYCFSCRKPSDPAFGELEFHVRNTKQGHLKALCSSCSTVMNKGATLATLAAIDAQYSVRIIQADKRLVDEAQPR